MLLVSLRAWRLVAFLCLLSAIALPFRHEALASSDSSHSHGHTHAPDDALPGCGHDYVAAEQNSMPTTYVSFGKVKPSQQRNAAAAVTTSALDQPPRGAAKKASPPYRIIEMQAAAPGSAETSNSSSSSSSASSSEWAPIRIAVFTEDLTDESRYCTAIGQMRPDSMGNQVECTSTEDILTDAKREILLNFLLPEAVKAHTARLMVRPVASDTTIVVNSLGGRYCSTFTVPESHHTDGVADADFIVYAAAGPTSTPSSFIAWAVTCQYFPNVAGYPAVGAVYFNPRYLPESVDETDSEIAEYGGNAYGNANGLRRAATHELLHALGFTYKAFAATGTYTTVPSLRGKTNVPVLNGTAVRAAAIAQYGISDSDILYGVELEDQGASGTSLSHWKRRNAKDELMSPILNLARYSALSIAALEDLGHYKGIYEKAEPLPLGYGAGAAMFNEKCLTDAVTNVPTVFCDSTNPNIRACTADRLKIGRCYLTYYSADLPSYAQYFPSSPNYGGQLSYMDYCPVMQPLSNTACEGGTPSAIPGSLIGDGSRCFDATNLIVKTTYSRAYAICAKVNCNSTTRTYQVLVNGANSWLSCGAGGDGTTVKPATASADVYTATGTIACPRYDDVCYANPSAYDAITATTSAPATTAAPDSDAAASCPSASRCLVCMLLTAALLLSAVFPCA